MSIFTNLSLSSKTESKPYLDNMPGLISTSYSRQNEKLPRDGRTRRRGAPTLGWSWAPGLCGAPDAPALSEDSKINPSGASPLHITFALRLTQQTEAIWETVLTSNKLYIQLPHALLPDGSKEAFVTLLEYAEEVLHCTDIIVCMSKDRADRVQLIRTFMFLGFCVLPPGHPLIPNSSDTINLYMRYSIE